MVRLKKLSIFLMVGIILGFFPLGYGQDWWDNSPDVPGPDTLPSRILMATEWTANTGGELDQYLGNSYGGCGTTNNDDFVTFSLAIDQAISASNVLLTLSTWDVDYDASGTPEIDKVYINGHYLGNLTGTTDAWSINTFTVPISYVTAPGNNEIKVEVDTLSIANQSNMWCVKVDYGTISLSGSSSSGVSLGSCTDRGEDTDGDGKYNELEINVAVTPSSSGSFNINGALYDASNNLIGWAQSIQSLTQGANTMTLTFDGEDINCHLANGPYTLKNVTVYNTSNTSIRAFASQLCTTSTYTYSQFETCTSTCPIVISTDPVDGATGVSTSTPVRATFNVDMNASTLNTSTFSLAVTQNNLLTPVAGTVSYSASTRTATFTPSAALQANAVYTATISSGAQGAGGCGLQYTKTWSFTTGTGGGTGGTCIHPVSITLSQNCGAVGQPVTITASAQGTGVQYKFFVGLYDWCTGQSPSWVVVRDWNASNTASYTPTAQGRMIFFVWVASNTSDPCTGFAAITYLAGQSGGGGTASLQVTVVDATNATPISGASLSFAGNSGSTNASGVYTFSNVAAGTNTLTTSKSGYITNTQSVTLAAGENKQVTVALSPQLAAGQTRIVLTWGATPSDLDSHLTGAPASGTSRFHVSFIDEAPLGADANLDVDDTTSYGPETVTITQLHTGTYKYYIHDYTNRASTSSNAMAQSGAKVQVYQGSSLVATYNVPSQAGTLWYVFSMDGASGALTPQNQMMYESNPTGPSIQSVGAELGVFQDLPEK